MEIYGYYNIKLIISIVKAWYLEWKEATIMPTCNISIYSSSFLKKKNANLASSAKLINNRLNIQINCGQFVHMNSCTFHIQKLLIWKSQILMQVINVWDHDSVRKLCGDIPSLSHANVTLDPNYIFVTKNGELNYVGTIKGKGKMVVWGRVGSSFLSRYNVILYISHRLTDRH